MFAIANIDYSRYKLILKLLWRHLVVSDTAFSPMFIVEIYEKENSTNAQQALTDLMVDSISSLPTLDEATLKIIDEELRAKNLGTVEDLFDIIKGYLEEIMERGFIKEESEHDLIKDVLSNPVCINLQQNKITQLEKLLLTYTAR